jgi:hypothetical protein
MQRRREQTKSAFMRACCWYSGKNSAQNCQESKMSLMFVQRLALSVYSCVVLLLSNA